MHIWAISWLPLTCKAEKMWFEVLGIMHVEKKDSGLLSTELKASWSLLWLFFKQKQVKSVFVPQKCGTLCITAVHEPQHSLANVTWQAAMVWSLLDNSLYNHETYGHKNPTHTSELAPWLFSLVWILLIAAGTKDCNHNHHVFIVFQNGHCNLRHQSTPGFSRLCPHPHLTLPSHPPGPWSICLSAPAVTPH